MELGKIAENADESSAESSDNKIFPYVDETLNDMQAAHFISAAYDGYESCASNYFYEASCKIKLEDNEASFVLGDPFGEQGKLVLIEVRDFYSDEYARLVVKQFENGQERDDLCSEEISFDKSSDNQYEICVTAFPEVEGITGSLLGISVNNENIGDFEVEKFPLGTVGTYKRRGTKPVYFDDFEVLDLYAEPSKVIFKEDFEGNFVNELVEYSYENEATSAFSPYHIDIDDSEEGKRLSVKAGFVLSPAKAKPAPSFRRTFVTEDKEIENAYLCLTALGSVDAYLNKQKVTDNFFDPGKMSFTDHLNFVVYDVTSFVEKDNELQFDLFHGFFDRGVGYPETGGGWDGLLGVKGVLSIKYKDGTKQIIATDDSFEVCVDTRYRFNDIYNGEVIDDRFNADNSKYTSVLVDSVSEKYLKVPLTLKKNPGIQIAETLDCVDVSEPIPGTFVYDFGKDFSGTISIKKEALFAAGAKEGSVCTFRYGEILNSENLINSDDVPGTVFVENLLSADATDYYIPGGAFEYSEEDISFSHTYHGFRYVQITGLEKAIDKEAIKGLFISSAIKETGSFTCSNEIINQFYDNSKNSMRSNMMDVPTDCAQRDERLGWCGDAQMTSLFGMYQYDSKLFYENYVKEMVAMQTEEGMYMDAIPVRYTFGGHNCWGDAPVIIAWNLYLQYGDKEILEDNFDSFARWIDYLKNTSEDYYRDGGGYGDHLSAQGTPGSLSDTAWCAHSSRLVAKMAQILGRDDDYSRLNEIAEAFRAKWQETFIKSDASVETGILTDESETAYALGIDFGLFEENYERMAIDRLKLLTEYGLYMFYPGYSGMDSYLPALSKGGYGEDAIKVLSNTEPGGIAYPLTMGLTTNPEELGAFKNTDDDGNEFDNGGYVVRGSLDHAAYSAVCSYLFTGILGIKPDEEKPGYQHFFIEPTVQGLEYASGSFCSKYGEIAVFWNATDKVITCTVPKGSTCTLVLPDGSITELPEGQHEAYWN
ncbi:alpha-L-rhamnosidase [Butyrivibrio sp. XBB1001]|uniref:alpha-L-rhamnosidase n=1 Tax=Butyrivibrio sp. XBB1001 TaxID=1280682 RepID=UPI001A99D96E|nr:alpha-L-rhamnosidase [Butyrivibrio sp. XBB1001]